MKKYIAITLSVLIIFGFGINEFFWLQKYNCKGFDLAINHNLTGQDFYFYKRKKELFKNWQKVENPNYFRLTLNNDIDILKFSKLGEIDDLEIKNCLIQNNKW